MPLPATLTEDCIFHWLLPCALHYTRDIRRSITPSRIEYFIRRIRFFLSRLLVPVDCHSKWFTEYLGTGKRRPSPAEREGRTERARNREKKHSMNERPGDGEQKGNERNKARAGG